MAGLSRNLGSKTALGLSGTAVPNVAQAPPPASPLPGPSGAYDLSVPYTIQHQYEGMTPQDPVYGGDFMGTNEGPAVQSPYMGPVLGGSRSGYVGKGPGTEVGGFTAIKPAVYSLGMSDPYLSMDDKLGQQMNGKVNPYTSPGVQATGIFRQIGDPYLTDKDMLGQQMNGNVNPYGSRSKEALKAAMEQQGYLWKPRDTGVRPGVRPTVNAVQEARGIQPSFQGTTNPRESVLAAYNPPGVPPSLPTKRP